MSEFVSIVIGVALWAAFVLTLFRKWGITEYVQVHGNNFFSKMFHCDFCLSFWTSVIISVTLFVFSGCADMLFIPFLSTCITRILL